MRTNVGFEAVKGTVFFSADPEEKHNVFGFNGILHTCRATALQQKALNFYENFFSRPSAMMNVN